MTTKISIFKLSHRNKKESIHYLVMRKNIFSKTKIIFNYELLAKIKSQPINSYELLAKIKKQRVTIYVIIGFATKQ